MDDITLLDLERLRATLAHEAVGHTIDYHASLRSAMLPARALAGEPTTPSGVV